MKLLVLDGNSIINRAFYGIKLLSTKDGRFTNAVYGFLNILFRLLDEYEPDAVAAAWDLKAPTFRHEMFKDYKAGRRPTPNELLSQIPIAKKLICLLGYRSIECEGFEADDILGTLAAAAEQAGAECFIATGDRDSLQLISDRTRVVLSTTKFGRAETICYDRAALFEKYGLTPSGMLELKSLMGDSSDNIPGVPGIGEKTATELISAFGSIDYIYDNLDSLEIRESVREKLKAGKESAYLSRKLGEICKTAPIDKDLSHLAPSPRDDKALADLMVDLELYKILDRLGIDPSLAKKPEIAAASPLVFKKVDINNLADGDRLDIYREGDSLYLSRGGTACVCTVDDARPLLEDENIKLRVYDEKNLYKECRRRGITLRGEVFDSMLAGYLLSPSASNYELSRLAGEYGAATPEADQEILPAALHSAVCDATEKALSENDLSALLRDIELPLARVLGDMEIFGVEADGQGIREYGEELAGRISKLEEEIFSLVGYEFNLNSPKQLGEALFEKLGLPAKKKTKKGYATGAEVLEELRGAHPVVSLLLEYRRIAKLKSTYCDGLLKVISDDGRIHSTFNQTETRTGRISSLEPNLQNIPVRTEEGRRFRKYFVAKDGYLLCDADYSQIELRVLSHVAHDENMTAAFRSGADIHRTTASEVFGLPPEMVTDTMRSHAKAVNFGIVYGIGAFSLSKDIGVSRAEADRYIKGYLATYPRVAEYMQRVIEDAKRDGFVTTMFGRRRYLPELASSNAAVRAFGERVARNMPIQGAAADIIKIAMIRVCERIEREGLDARLILQIHDELIVEAAEKDARRACEIIKEEMEGAVKLDCGLSVDVGCGKTWYEAKA